MNHFISGCQRLCSNLGHCQDNSAGVQHHSPSTMNILEALCQSSHSQVQQASIWGPSAIAFQHAFLLILLVVWGFRDPKQCFLQGGEFSDSAAKGTSWKDSKKPKMQSPNIAWLSSCDVCPSPWAGSLPASMFGAGSSSLESLSSY